MSIGSHVVALYAEGGDLELIDLHTVVKYKTPQPSTDRETEEGIDLAAATKPLVGILYSTWHAQLGALTMQECAREAKMKNSTCPTTEYVIQKSHAGQESIRIKDLQSAYSVTPKKGFYCI